MIDKVANGGCNTQMLAQPERQSLVICRDKRVRPDELGKSERIHTVEIKTESVRLNDIHCGKRKYVGGFVWAGGVFDSRRVGRKATNLIVPRLTQGIRDPDGEDRIVSRNISQDIAVQYDT